MGLTKDISRLKKLFEEGRIDLLIGYEQATLPHQTMPCFIKSADNLEKLVLSPFMAVNLVHYLNEASGKPGLIIKRCDIPSVIGLIQEGMLARDKIVLIGVVCPGSLDWEKFFRKTGWKAEQTTSVRIDKDKVILECGGQSKQVALADVLMDKCLACDRPVPSEDMVDLLIGDPATAKRIPVTASPAAERIAELEKMSPAQRWAFWKKELQKCIRCYACKNSCPVCYCTRCTVEINNPRWVSPANDWQDNVVYQLMRLDHVAGRCTNCGECTRACPVGIPLNLFTGRLFNTVVESFDFVPGQDPAAKPPTLCFRPDDREDFIK